MPKPILATAKDTSPGSFLPTRDGWVLPDGKILLTLSKSTTYPGGGVLELDRDGKVLFKYQGTQSEVNTAQAVDNGKILISEAGDNPRLLEVDRNMNVIGVIPLRAQIKDHHLQTRMARKLGNGNFLVPQLLDQVVREYTPKGEVVWEVKTPNMPFTAIRLANGNTLIGCTRGDMIIEVDLRGNIVWKLTNDELPDRPIRDACGIQRLPDGNTVIASYGAHQGQVKLLEVTPAKKLVWAYRDAKAHGIHHFQILDSSGQAISGIPLR